MKTLYLTNEGILKREGNTIYFVRKDEKRSVPIHNLREVVCIAPVTLTSGATSYLLRAGVPVHFFNTHGYYEGTLYPRERSVAGVVVIKQAEHYLDVGKRMYIATEMVNGIKHNMMRNLQKMRSEGRDVESYMERLSGVEVSGDDIVDVMNREAQMWQIYYRSLDATLDGFSMERREYNPPSNEVNALISFGNSLLYTAVLTEIYHTHLNPAISYLHEPSERRFSLSLDIADVFKPVVVMRHLHYLVNRGIITGDDFRRDMKGCFLNEAGKRKFLQRWEERMSSTVYHRNLKRKVSMRHMLRLEAYKLLKHVMNDKRYRSFRVWW